MALQTREFTGSTGSQYWTWKIRVIEDNYIENNVVSTNKVLITIESYLGRTTTAGNSFFDGRATLNFNAGSQQSGSIPFVGGSNVNAGAWYKMGSHSFVVDNTGTINNPTQLSVSGSMSGAGFSPYSASANGTLSLTPLHTPPQINSVNISETKTQLTSLGVSNNTIVQYLSTKKFTITVQTFDNATITNYSVYHNNVLIGTSTSDTITINFANVGELIDSGTGQIGLNIAVTDSLGGYTTKIFNFPIIKYTKPSIEFTSTNIRRKTGNGTVLTDNKVLLNFVGNCYKGNDVIGDNNKPTVQYKIWNGTEPNYTTLTTSNVANVNIKNYEISNILYTSIYNYKIKIYDVFTTTESTTNLKSDKVPTGVSVWTEYKDKVEFLKIVTKSLFMKDDNGNETNLIDWLNTGRSIRLHKTSRQNLSPQTTTIVSWQEEDYNDTNGILVKDGNYVKVASDISSVLVTAQYQNYVDTDKYIYIRRLKANGTVENISSLGTVDGSILACHQVPVEKNDKIYIEAYSTASSDIETDPAWVNFNVTILR